jgi:hypothetical protein
MDPRQRGRSCPRPDLVRQSGNTRDPANLCPSRKLPDLEDVSCATGPSCEHDGTPFRVTDDRTALPSRSARIARVTSAGASRARARTPQRSRWIALVIDEDCCGDQGRCLRALARKTTTIAFDHPRGRQRTLQ